MITVITSGITSITPTTASGGGLVTISTGITISARGVVWNTAPNPTTANFKTTNGSGAGAFVSSLTGLVADNTYYVKAYASTLTGTTYGNQVVFNTGLAVNMTADLYDLWKKIGYVAGVTPTDESVAIQLAYLDAQSIIHEKP